MMALRSTKEIPRYVQSHLLNTIVADPALVLDTPQAVRQGYLRTNDALIMDKSIKSDPTYVVNGFDSSCVHEAVRLAMWVNGCYLKLTESK